ncbi:hypothetical protein SESBI_31229 [Sesbania bispinosa]|nr:hypothetical protein SESBI_31229 [Sesbania bispinosa]
MENSPLTNLLRNLGERIGKQQKDDRGRNHHKKSPPDQDRDPSRSSPAPSERSASPFGGILLFFLLPLNHQSSYPHPPPEAPEPSRFQRSVGEECKLWLPEGAEVEPSGNLPFLDDLSRRLTSTVALAFIINSLIFIWVFLCQ